MNKNLLVAPSETLGLQIVNRLGLDRSKWLVRSVCGPLTGHRFDNVLWLVDEPQGDQNRDAYLSYRDHVRTKLDVGGHFFESELSPR